MACCVGKAKRSPEAEEATAAEQIEVAVQDNPDSKLVDQSVCVFGGLGRQGAAVALEILAQHPRVKEVRLVSRKSPEENKDSLEKVIKEKINTLGTRKEELFSKVKIVQADMGVLDEKLESAVKDCYAAFIVTAFWPSAVDHGTGATQPLDPVYESLCAMNAFQACQKVGSVKHVVYSCLEDSRWYSSFTKTAEELSLKPLKEGMYLPHFDGKGECMVKMNEQDEIALDFVWVGFYLENWFGMKPNKGEDGKYALYMPIQPETPQYAVSVADLGKFVSPLFNRKPEKTDTLPNSSQGKSWPISGAISVKYTGTEICKMFSKLIGEDVNYVCVPVEAFAQAGIGMGMPEAAAWDFAHMFQFFNDETYLKAREDALGKAPKGVVNAEEFLNAVGGLLFPKNEANLDLEV